MEIDTDTSVDRSAKDLLTLVHTSLDDDKAEEIVVIDLTGKSTIADHLVVASGRSTTQVGAIADHLVRRMKKAGFGPVHVEGLQNCDWVLVDAGDIIVHLFRPEVRAFYNIEKMWSMDVPDRQNVS